MYQLSFEIFVLAAVLFGAVFGSFLNVVICRLPIMISSDKDKDAPYNLIVPPSTCPHCSTQIKAWHNIPVISFGLLKGHCAHCQGSISWQYPLVELAAAGLAVLCYLQFGLSVQTLAAFVFVMFLLAISVIDYKYLLILDVLSLPLIGFGVLVSFWSVFSSINDALMGALLGYGFLWAIYWVTRLSAGKEAMGYGDFKLFAAIGAWLGWQMLPVVLLTGSLIGSLFGAGLMVAGRWKSGIEVPFGPFLATGALIALF